MLAAGGVRGQSSCEHGVWWMAAGSQDAASNAEELRPAGQAAFILNVAQHKRGRAGGAAVPPGPSAECHAPEWQANLPWAACGRA